MALSGGSGGGGSARGIEAGRAYVRLGAKDDLTAHLKRIGGKFADFGKTVLGATGIGGLAGGVIGGLSFKDAADDIRKMQDAIKAMGLTASGGSGLFGVLNQFSDIGENVEGLTQFSQKVQDAFDGVGAEGAKLFEGLSVSAKDLIDLPLDEKFLRIHGAIRELPQAQQQFKLSMLGGTDSMKKWLPLLDMSNEELRAQAKELAFTAEEMDRASKASKAMRDAGAAVGRVWQTAVIALAPLVTQAANALTGILKPVAAWLQGRTLQDMWDELVARLVLGWEEMKQAGRQAFWNVLNLALTMVTALPDQLKGIWSGLVVGAAAQFNAVGSLFGTLLTQMAAKGAEVFGKIGEALTNPLKAAEIGMALVAAPIVLPALTAEAVRQAVERAGPELAALAAAAGAELTAELDKAKKALGDAVDLKKGQAEVEAARQRVKDVEDRVAARRRQQLAEELLNMPVGGPTLAAKVAGVGHSMGTFGVGSFLRQGFGVQSGQGVAKEQLKEQKRGNVLLKDVVKAVENIPIPRFL